jgi:CubicO group peptidase (beta-lactamase class C family)
MDMSTRRLLAMLFLAAGSLCGQREDKTFTAGPTGKRIAEWFANAEVVGFSGVVLAAKDGKVVAAVGVGHADLHGKVPITPATLFEIASATKQFTGAAVMRLVQAGKLKLDDPMSKHLPGVPQDCAGITVRHLLQHTSGIPGSNAAGGGEDLALVLPSFLNGGPQQPPGKHWAYWNQGYALLSEIIARASGKSYVEFCKQELFANAEMRTTLFTGDPEPKGAVVAVGQSSRGAPRSALEHPYGSYGFQYRGMGGAVTNVWELWRWDRALHGDQVLSDAAKAALFEPGLNDYALGWFVRKDQQGRLVHSHGGSVRGFLCDVRRYPKEDGCLFVLGSRGDVPIHHVTKGLEEILFNDPPTLRALPGVVDAKLASALAGSYADDNGVKLMVELDGLAVRTRIEWVPGNDQAPITHALLGVEGKNDLVFYEWTSTTPVEVKRRGRDPVTEIKIGSHRYRRSAR